MVPAIMHSSVFFFHLYRRMIPEIAMISGNPCCPEKNDIFFRQYITNMPITAEGRTLPRYWT